MVSSLSVNIKQKPLISHKLHLVRISSGHKYSLKICNQCTIFEGLFGIAASSIGHGLQPFLATRGCLEQEKRSLFKEVVLCAALRHALAVVTLWLRTHYELRF